MEDNDTKKDSVDNLLKAISNDKSTIDKKLYLNLISDIRKYIYSVKSENIKLESDLELENIERQRRNGEKFLRGIQKSIAIITGISAICVFFTPQKRFYNKSSFERKISAIINNGGGLESIKHIQKNIDNADEKKSYCNYLFDKEVIEVTDKPNLTNLLFNLKAQYYEDTSKAFINDINSLNSIIAKYNTTNPFDNLEENQRYLFNNVVNQSDTLYQYIEEDVNKIVDELVYKNDLVKEYLSNAKSSYRNSIIAMSISTLSLLLVVYINFINKNRKQ